MEGFLYVADEAGEEIEGSRRSLSGCRSVGDYWRICSALAAQAGEGCTIKDSVVDRVGRAE